MTHAAQVLATRQKQRQALGARQLQGIGLLMKSLPELRQELARAISENPVLEDLDHPLETPLSAVERHPEEEGAEASDYPSEDDVSVFSRDEQAAERRQAFFDNQVKTETLQSHLLSQLPLTDIPPQDVPLIELLVGDLDDNGFYRGSIPDVCMAFGCTEAKVRQALKAITALDPPGCGATTAKECLLAQLDALDGSPHQDLVRRIIENHLELLAARGVDAVAEALAVSREECLAAIQALRTLNARPGASFPGEHDRVEYVNPEVHAMKVEDTWMAMTDKRSLPEIRIAKRYLDWLKDPAQSEETKAYVRARIAAARALREQVAHRQETIESIAQTIFNRQSEFFEKGFAALKPLTETEVAKEVGVDVATVSRTVNGKYAATPFGTVELRRFFIAPVKTENGVFLQQEALDALRDLVANEDVAAPLSDAKLAEAMAGKGFSLARRTVAKYRERLGISSVAERTKKEMR